MVKVSVNSTLGFSTSPYFSPYSSCFSKDWFFFLPRGHTTKAEAVIFSIIRLKTDPDMGLAAFFVCTISHKKMPPVWFFLFALSQTFTKQFSLLFVAIWTLLLFQVFYRFLVFFACWLDLTHMFIPSLTWHKFSWQSTRKAYFLLMLWHVETFGCISDIQKRTTFSLQCLPVNVQVWLLFLGFLWTAMLV